MDPSPSNLGGKEKGGEGVWEQGWQWGANGEGEKGGIGVEKRVRMGLRVGVKMTQIGSTRE